MALQSKELIFNQKPCMQDTFAHATHSAGRPSAARDDRVSCIQPAKPDRSVGFPVRGETYFFYIYTTIPIPNPKDPGKTGDIII